MLSFSVILTGYHLEVFRSVSFTSLGLPSTKGAGHDSDVRKLRITNTKFAAALINSSFLRPGYGETQQKLKVFYQKNPLSSNTPKNPIDSFGQIADG
jgi:hypothetical protein